MYNRFRQVTTCLQECIVCKSKLSYKGGAINNLHRHLRNVHPTVPLEKIPVEPGINEGASVSFVTVAPVAAAAVSISPFISTPTQRPKRSTRSSMEQFLDKTSTSAKQKKIDEELVKMIATDFQPFSIVDDKGFRKFIHVLNQLYVFPSSKTLSEKMIPDLYHRERASVQERVNKATSVCLTTDSWTSQANTSFMSVTCHFIENYKRASCLLDCFEFSNRYTYVNLAEELLRVAKEWNVENKVVACVTDNIANLAKAVRFLKWIHHPCFANTINLIVRDALKVIKPVVDKVRVIVEFFRRSTAATNMLKSIQQQMGMPDLNLKQDCATTWNSTFYMLKRILESKDAVMSTLCVINAPIAPLSQEKWEVVRETCTVLEPFEQVTLEISTKSYVTASKMLILCRGLQRVTVENQTSILTANVKELVNTLCAMMNKMFHRLEYNIVLSETTILDPRFKKLAFNDTTAFDETVQRITSRAARFSHPSPMSEGQEGTEEKQERRQESDVWRLFEERLTGDSTRRNPLSDSIMEVRSYLEEPLFQRSADPLNWWESRASVYPRLTYLMKLRLCIVATSIPSERIFSKPGQIITDRRSQIRPSIVKQLVFLNANLQ
ncbi:zinc finger BED domain-containing protein 4-like [Lepeophtheirus salmonis]|uniref:zinc finger BED domain-containing protein 4-like n=1 Tax=Lepeophtheirus salmonis TaxID=72036 RepID=UPI001AE513BE|nr:zinc finger BED domain-containing protein 4-like [Lepeophtheirus salmonis]